MKVYAVFKRPKNQEGYLEEPIAVFSNEAVAELSASRLSMGSGEAYFVGCYHVLEETNVPVVPIVAMEGTISFSMKDGVVSSSFDFQVVSCKRKDDGVAELVVDRVPTVYTDPYGNSVVTYNWEAVVDVLETDTIDSVKKRLSSHAEDICRTRMYLMDPFNTTIK